MKLLWSLLLVSFLCGALARHEHTNKHDKDEAMIHEDDEGKQEENFELLGMEKSHNGYGEKEVSPLKGVESMEDEEEEGDSREQNDNSWGQDDGKAYAQDAKAEIQWQNHHHRSFGMNCGRVSAIYSVHSVFHRGAGDRVWSWACRRVSNSAYTQCQWSGDENAWTGNMNFTCLANQVLTGVHGAYVRPVNDRRWRFLCCKSHHQVTTNCYTTKWANTPEETIFYRVGAPRVFTGATSIYDHDKKDRIWQFKICEYGSGISSRA